MKVVKRYEIPNHLEGRIRGEAKLLQNLHHKNILQVFDFFETSDEISTVLEL